MKAADGNPDAGEAPEADVLEQAEPAGAQAAEGSVRPPEVGERPEADVLEQAQPVDEDQLVDRSSRHETVSEADWLDQTVSEPLEEERR